MTTLFDAVMQGPAPTRSSAKGRGHSENGTLRLYLGTTAEDVPKPATVTILRSSAAIVALCGQVRVRRGWKAAAPSTRSPAADSIPGSWTVCSVLHPDSQRQVTYLLAQPPICEAIEIEWRTRCVAAEHEPRPQSCSALLRHLKAR